MIFVSLTWASGLAWQPLNYILVVKVVVIFSIYPIDKIIGDIIAHIRVTCFLAIVDKLLKITRASLGDCVELFIGTAAPIGK